MVKSQCSEGHRKRLPGHEHMLLWGKGVMSLGSNVYPYERLKCVERHTGLSGGETPCDISSVFAWQMWQL